MCYIQEANQTYILVCLAGILITNIYTLSEILVYDIQCHIAPVEMLVLIQIERLVYVMVRLCFVRHNHHLVYL